MKFLKNLYEIASSDAHPAITWNKEGNGIVILDKLRFIQESLPRICKTDEYGTFIRQLNNYGFAKVKAHDIDEFINDRFRKNSPETLALLKRKTTTEKAPDLLNIYDNQQTLYTNVSHLNEINRKLLNEMYYLKEKVSQQEKTINELVKAFINLFNKPETRLEKLQIADPEKKAMAHLAEISDANEDTEDSAIDAFLDDEFGRV